MANFSVRRGTQEEIDATPIVDGQLFFNTTSNKIEMDYLDERLQYGGDTTVESVMSTTSVNPLQNKVVTNELNKKVNISAIVDDYNVAVSTIEDDVPVGCKTISGMISNNFTANGKPFIFDYQNGQYGWNEDPDERGADTFHPFRSQNYVTLFNNEIGAENGGVQITNIDCKSIPNYKNLTIDDFNIRTTYIRVRLYDIQNTSSASPPAKPITYTYNASNGILTIEYDSEMYKANGRFTLFAYPTILITCAQ